jgi:hypothetical protein
VAKIGGERIIATKAKARSKSTMKGKSPTTLLRPVVSTIVEHNQLEMDISPGEQR